ncbi:MAG: carboxypeptidase-like regulatory domain-containing protein, partial [Bacteriovoracaceae bacterium]
MNKFLLLLVLFSLGMTQIAAAQKSDVRGVVTDTTSGEKIPYATISVTGTARGAVTNNNGFFLLANLPPGTY